VTTSHQPHPTHKHTPRTTHLYPTVQEAVGSLFDHLRLARQRSLAGRSPGMTSGQVDSERSVRTAVAASSSSSSSSSSPPPPSPVKSLLGPSADGLLADSFEDGEAVNETLAQLLFVMERLDDKISPMLEQDGRHFSQRWGFLSRAGLNDKSQLCRQIEKYAGACDDDGDDEVSAGGRYKGTCGGLKLRVKLRACLGWLAS